MFWILLTGVSPTLSAQNFGNEWINYTNTYYQLPIYETGVYRITYNQLNNAGVPLSSINSNDFKIYGRDQEQAIFVFDGNDGAIDPGDYIEFYAQKNDAWLDEKVYSNPDDVANKYYSLYNDTINYFLTWDNGTNGERYQLHTDINFGSYSALPFVWHKSFVSRNNQYLEGPLFNGASTPLMARSEGWFSNSLNGGQTTQNLNNNVSTPLPYTGPGAPDARVEAVSASNSNASYTGQGNHHLRVIVGGNTFIDTIFSGYQLNKLFFDVPASVLSNTTTVNHQIVADQGALTDLQAVATIDIDYPRIPNFNNTNAMEFTVPFNNNASKSLIEFTNFGGASPIAYALTGNQVQKLTPILSGTNLSILVPNDPLGNDRKVIIIGSSQLKSVSNIAPVNGTGNFTDYSNFSGMRPYVIVSHPSLSTGAQAYANYRSSSLGGSFNVLQVNVEDLFLQFGGGIRKHQIAIKRFMDYIYQNWSTPPEYLFLIGKCIRENDESSATGPGARKNALSYSRNLVPSFGYPNTDAYLTCGLNGENPRKQVVPVGRFSAESNAEILSYLDKVQTFEQEQDPNAIYNKPNKDWQKQVLHFGGGSDAYEQNLFKSFLNKYADTIGGVQYGAHINSFFKNTSDPIDPVVIGEVSDRISNGVSVMTFFGHASADGFDQNVDDPEDWNNSGRYPLVIGNACYTGDIFQPESMSTSEEWVKISGLGAIAFLSTVKLGFVGSLNTYSTELYGQISNRSYGESIGKALMATNHTLFNYSPGIYIESSLYGMTLHGDPALKVNPHDKPEFDIEQSDVFFSPETIDLSVDSITVSLVVTNLGKAYPDGVAVELVREFPGNGGDSTYIKILDGSYYKDTVHFTIPLYANIGVGINNFKLSVDIPSQIEEQYDEMNNNTTEKTLFIDIDGIYPVWPYDYAVIPNDTVTVKASTVNPFADFNTYRFEIDTTDLYNSPQKRFAIKSGLGGVHTVKPNEWLGNSGGASPLTLTDSTVYFWRVAIDSSELNWHEHSFQYISDKTGWGQEHFFQFKNNHFGALEYDRDDRLFKYGDTYKILKCEVFGNGSNVNEWFGTLWRMNGDIQEYGLCGLTPSLHVAVIDPLSLEPWGTFYNGQNPNHQFGNANNGSSCRARVEYYFNFRQNDLAQLQAFENMILNEIPDDYYILVYTTQTALFDQWSSLYPNIYNTFQTELGSDSLQAGHANVPFILFTQKGNPSFTKEVLGPTIDDYIELEDTLFGFDFAGNMRSTIVGPAESWETVYWKQNALEQPTTDSSRLKIYGRDFMNVETLLVDTLLNTNDSILNFNSLYPASSYPMLRLETIKYDSVDFTPAQLDGWHVLHTPVPEAALDGIDGYYFTLESDSIQEGAEISLGVDIRNISPYDMDSLLVSYKIEDRNRVFHNLPYPRQDSLRAHEKFRDTITFSTKGFPGFNSLWIEVNPYSNGVLKDQPEMYHFNNVAQLPFRVFRDDENPILDVTFDGVHILQGDIVSGRPEIVMSLKDENPFLLMDSEADTTNFGIYLTDPDGNQKQLYFMNSDGSQNMEFIPAGPSDKKFKIIYNPTLEKDGEYTLLVQGADKSDNLSGDFEYRISFEVINRSTITHLMNYPNPFSTRTAFVFTLTGNKIPDYMKIQIMTVTGKVVREITMNELGPIRVGRNITEYQWNGRDEFGDQLANGVYLYRVIAEIDGEAIEHRGTDADQYFTKGFGKMYLMR